MKSIFHYSFQHLVGDLELACQGYNPAQTSVICGVDNFLDSSRQSVFRWIGIPRKPTEGLNSLHFLAKETVMDNEKLMNYPFLSNQYRNCQCFSQRHPTHTHPALAQHCLTCAIRHVHPSTRIPGLRQGTALPLHHQQDCQVSQTCAG